MSEHDTQAAFFQAMALKNIPGVELMHAIPNGGHRHIAVAAKLKKEGVKAGVLDVQWPVARGGYIGLAIEFKHGTNGPSREQVARITALQKEGWCVAVCWDWQAAVRVVEGYSGMMHVAIQSAACRFKN